jgi:hypothetical protein
MRKFIYQSIIDKLKEINDGHQSVIRHFDIWNNNIVYICENEAFDTPAVFVEFRQIDWRLQGKTIREANVTVVLHVVTQRNAPTSDELPYAQLALEFFDLLTDINVCLTGHNKTGDYFGHDDLTPVSSITDNDFDELIHSLEVFSCHAMDAKVLDVPVQTLNNVKLIINN